MMCYKNKSYCSSPNCTNECGRKITKEIIEDAKRVDLPICSSNFCDTPELIMFLLNADKEDY